ncbi:hypothetical protein EXS57_00285 [Candidatus Kaiserbacteria bacterium]|nr:hypothetical protein [Candidatus Kaiserbacteria bacterium]
MNVLGKWGAYIFIPQMLIGIATYGAAFLLGGVDVFGQALFVVGGATALYSLTAMYRGEELAVTLSLSSFSAILMLLCLPTSSIVSAVVFGFFSVSLAVLAALLVKNAEASEDKVFSHLVLDALPIIGALRYLGDVFDKEAEKLRKKWLH